MTSDAKWRARRNELAGSRARTLLTAARLGIAAAAALIFAVLPLQAQTDTVLYSFAGGTTSGPDGANPASNLLRDASGNLYGTTEAGGTTGNGTVFELVNDPAGTYTEKLLYEFRGNANDDGALPFAGLVMDSSGNLFGTTSLGGTSNAGTVFELVNINGSYTERVLHAFLGGLDGAQPYSTLVMDTSGNLFGTTLLGGASGFGTVFEMVNSGGTYTESILWSFHAGVSDGGLPYDGLVIDAIGNLYGTASLGGPSNAGTVFELINNPPGTYTEKVLYNFTGFNGDGRSPQTSLIIDSSNNLYGTTLFGGTSTACGTKLGCGTAFELAYSSTSQSYAATTTILHTFLGGSDGGSPSSLIMDSSGNLYGTTQVGGGSTTCVYGCGTVFELLYSTTGYTEKSPLLNIFPNSADDGLVPDAGLVIDSSGNLYGTTTGGGVPTTACGNGTTAAGCGTVFEVAASAASADLGITGSASPSPVQVDSTLTYTLTVTNSGPSGATGVTLTDTLPSGISLNNTTASQGACADAGGIVTCSIGSLANGAAASVTLTVTTPSSAGILANTATVTANESDPNLSNNTSTITVDVLAPSSVPPQIVKTFGAGSIPLNGVTSLNFSISNPNSAASLSGISFTDSFPAGLAIAAFANLTNNSCGGTASGAAGGSAVSLSGGTLAAGTSCTISLNVTGTNVGTIMNSVSVTSTQTGAGNTSIASVVVQSGLFSPTSGIQGQTLNVSFTGSGFIAGVTSVRFGTSTSGITVNSVTVEDSGDLVANITIGTTAKVGVANVIVTTGMTRLNYGRFQVQSPVLVISPSTGTQGETLDVTLTGLTFVSGMTAQFGPSASGITVNSLTIQSTTEAIANVTIALNAPQKSVSVTVTNGQSSFTEAHAFTVKPASLTLSPSVGTQGETLDVTLTGLTFVPGMTVQFGSSTSGIAVNSFTVVTASEAIANVSIALNAPTQSLSVIVTNGESSFIESKAFKVGPASLALSPNTGTQGETLDVTLTGLTFVPGMTAQFGSNTSGITVNNVTVPNSSEAIVNITIALNANTNTSYSVTVSNGQSSFSEAKAFKVGPASLTLSPNTGTQGETLDVTLTGLTFVPGMTVQFGSSTSGITVNTLAIPNASEAIANITIAWNAPTQSLNVSVTNGEISFIEPQGFKIGPPFLTLSPDTGEVGQTLNVVMSGLPFESGPAGLSFTPFFSTRSFKLNSLIPIDANDAIANITIEPNASPMTYDVSVIFQGPPRLDFRNVGAFTVIAPQRDVRKKESASQ